MKISIITPSYNSKNYIEKCINSVISQSYKDIEYIIMDGLSDDGTLDILNKYKDKIKFFSEKDNGNYDAIKKGFEKATGDVITWIDSDNYYYSDDVIEKIMKAFISNELELVVTNCYYHYEGSKKMHVVSPARNKINRKTLINSGNIFMPECVFYKKNLYEKSGGLNLKYKLLADYELWIKMLNSHPKLDLIPMISSVYEVRSDALLRKNFLLSWKESFLIGNIYNRNFFIKIKFYFLYIKSQIRYSIVSIINKNKNLKNFLIRHFR